MSIHYIVILDNNKNKNNSPFPPTPSTPSPSPHTQKTKKYNKILELLSKNKKVHEIVIDHF
jgi:hypothetical protein